MVLGAIELMIFFMMLSMFLLTVPALIDIVRLPSSAWKAAGQIQVLWLVLVLAFPVLGAIAYFFMVRRDVAAAHRGIEGAMA